MRVLRRGRQGFSLTEVLIAVAVLSIGILGTMAALAFGVRATDLGSNMTTAVNLNRKMLEAILSRDSKFTVYDNGVYKFAPTATGGFDGDIPSSWSGSTSDPHFEGPLAAVNEAGWHALNAPPFRTQDFVDSTAPKDVQRFERETLPNFQRNIVGQVVAASPSYECGMARIIVTTRWRDKGVWKYVRTEGMVEN